MLKGVISASFPREILESMEMLPIAIVSLIVTSCEINGMESGAAIAI